MFLNTKKLNSCATDEDLQALKDTCGDWVAGCGVPTIYTATILDLPEVRHQVVAHFCYHR